MAYTNFKPTIWSAHIQHELPKFTVFEQDCNYRFKGEVGRGKTVKILGVTRPTIGDYDGSDIGTPETISDTNCTLAIDQAKYFNFMVDDVDEAQSIEGLMPALMEESTRAMAEERDSYIAKLVSQQSESGMVSASTKITTAAEAKKAIDAGIKALWKQGVSQKDNVTVYLSPEVYLLFSEYLTEVKTNNDETVASGVLGTYSGAKIKMSNNFYNDKTDDYLFIKTSKAVAFCSGIDSVEAYRPDGLFSDAVKGLNTFGGKIVRPKELYVLKAHYA